MPLNVTSAKLALPLPANALVRDFTVRVQADSAGWMQLGAIGQVRVRDASSGQVQRTTVVVDFGIPLTVAAVQVPEGSTFKLRGVWRWRGDSFELKPALWATTDTSGTGGEASVSFAEISTQRLQLELAGALTQQQAEALTAQLPVLPEDLELRINGGPPVWSYPEPVRGGTDGWIATGSGATQVTYKDVSLKEAVEPLVGNPDSAANVSLLLELRARVPGRLSLVAGAINWDLLYRVPLQPDGRLTFDAEGAQELPLGPAAKLLREVRLSVVATLPKERAVPAVGPALVPQVELVLDAGRSACVRLPEDVLAELTALRLPLRAAGGEAEVRAQLLAPVGGSGAEAGEPGSPLEGLSVTNPVTLEPLAAGSTSEGWTLLPFDKPVALKGAVWVSLRVTRGTVRWSLGAFAHQADAYPVRRGAPTGPWVPLPSAVTTAQVNGQTVTVGGRLHAIGHAPKEHPLAPVQLQVAYPSASPLPDPVEVTPTAKGVAVKLQVSGSVPAQNARLRVVSRTTGTVTVQDLVTVVAK